MTVKLPIYEITRHAVKTITRFPLHNENEVLHLCTFQASETEPLNKEETGDVKDDASSGEITMSQTKEEVV